MIHDMVELEEAGVPTLPVEESADRWHIVCVGADDRALDLVFGTTTPATVEIGDWAAM